MADKIVVYKPILDSKSDIYQNSVQTQYARDQTTGNLFLTSGTNTRCIIPEQFKSAKLIGASASAINTQTTIYTVPAGKIFILSSAQVSSTWHDAIVNLITFGNLRYHTGGVPTTIIRTFGVWGLSGTTTISLNPSSILVFTAGYIFEVASNSAQLNCGGCLLGYEIDVAEYHPAI